MLISLKYWHKDDIKSIAFLLVRSTYIEHTAHKVQNNEMAITVRFERCTSSAYLCQWKWHNFSWNFNLSHVRFQLSGASMKLAEIAWSAKMYRHLFQSPTWVVIEWSDIDHVKRKNVLSISFRTEFRLTMCFCRFWFYYLIELFNSFDSYSSMLQSLTNQWQ